ncbi:MAG: ATP-dependent metallopeptidase FtsH/Yme1/Tma family protein, partial [candidate division WOR-3 bacterium]
MAKPPIKLSVIGNLLIWILIFLFVWGLWNLLFLRRGGKATIEYSQFIKELNNQNIKSVTITEKEIVGSLKQESYIVNDKGKTKFKDFKTYIPFDDPELVNKLLANNVSIVAKPSSPWSSILIQIVPWIFFIGLWIFLIRRMSAGSDRAFSFGKSRARLLTTDRPKVTFDDVAGVDEAKEELKEVIEF